jgi:hypothetical protein
MNPNSEYYELQKQYMRIAHRFLSARDLCWGAYVYDDDNAIATLPFHDILKSCPSENDDSMRYIARSAFERALRCQDSAGISLDFALTIPQLLDQLDQAGDTQ